MANLVTFAKKLWKDKVGGNTPITAAELNRIESGVNDCANQINKLGDSVSRIRVIRLDRQSQNESLASVLARNWSSINVNIPTFVRIDSDIYGPACLIIAYKTTDAYGVALKFGYDEATPQLLILANGKWNS